MRCDVSPKATHLIAMASNLKSNLDHTHCITVFVWGGRWHLLINLHNPFEQLEIWGLRHGRQEDLTRLYMIVEVSFERHLLSGE